MNALVLLCAIATAVAAQSKPSTGDVTGVVTDSLRGRPLAGATVQFTPAATTDPAAPMRTWTADADARGRYTISGLPAGRYLAGFFHPVLDSLGFGTEPRGVDIGPGTTRVDFGIPSAATIVSAICPGRAAGDSSALLVGHVRRAGTAEALGGATVAATWTALVQEAVLVKSQEQQALAPVTPEGWFAICGIAPETPVLVRAVAGEDSSGYVRLTLPARGVGHQPLYVGGGDAAVRVTGTVRDAQGRPVPNGQAHVWGTGRTAPTSAQGEFVLDSVPAGTQTVEVRAIGYTPVAQVVHLTGAPAQLRVVLTEPVTTLPAATITARSTATLRMKSFYQRMAEAEKGINRGYFVTPEELERRKPPLVTNLFNDFPGVTVARTQSLRKSIVKGPLYHGHGEAARCSMTIYLDGIRIIDGGVRPDTSKGYLDEVVDAAHLAAVEVYPHPVSAPPQYQSLNGTCGVILLWSK